MTTAELIALAKELRKYTAGEGRASAVCAMSSVKEFLRVYAGADSSFYRDISKCDNIGHLHQWGDYARGTLDGFILYVESGLLKDMSLERAAQIDVVSDFLQQAQDLLQDKDSHPAAPAMLVGAALEEFLRNWVEAENLPLTGKKLCISTYCDVLRANDFIGKQDAKDITAWAGLRNHAAHGEWDEVRDRAQVSLMMQGVNLFMRKYGPNS